MSRGEGTRVQSLPYLTGPLRRRQQFQCLLLRCQPAVVPLSHPHSAYCKLTAGGTAALHLVLEISTSLFAFQDLMKLLAVLYAAVKWRNKTASHMSCSWCIKWVGLNNHNHSLLPYVRLHRDWANGCLSLLSICPQLRL